MELRILRQEQLAERNHSKKFKEYFLANRQEFKYKTVESTEVLTYKGMLYMTSVLHNKIIIWYHHHLCHPGTTRLLQTLRQTMIWPGISVDCEKFTKTCEKCQCFKKKQNKIRQTAK